MDRRSLIRPVRAIVVCAALALMLLPPVAYGAAPTQGLGGLQRTVGEAVTQAAEFVKPPAPPVAPAPAPAPKPASRAPAPPASSPSPPPAAQTAPAPARPSRTARASSSQKGSSPDGAAPKRPSPPPARSSGSQPVEPTDRPPDTPDPAVVTVADLGDGDDEASLPFTGSNLLPLLAVAVLVLLTGAGLRRAVRMR